LPHQQTFANGTSLFGGPFPSVLCGRFSKKETGKLLKRLGVLGAQIAFITIYVGLDGCLKRARFFLLVGISGLEYFLLYLWITSTLPVYTLLHLITQ